MIPAFLGLAGTSLSDSERAFFKEAAPAGYILFARNVGAPDEVRALIDELKTLHGNERLPILIDQEGGRVARLKAPHWENYPPQSIFGNMWDRAPLTAMAAARANATALAHMLSAVGVTVDCLPLLDVAAPGMHDVIGDRAYGSDPIRVASLGRATLDGLKAGGVVGVVKHIPGHGRATADSHLDLPTVSADAEELEADLFPFRRLADAPMAMTAHILYSAWDPDRCATLSPVVIDTIIRGRCGFDGLLMSDDLNMHALSNQPGCETMGARGTAVIAAGCDIALHCSGDMAEMESLAAALPPATPRIVERLERAMAWAGTPADDPKGAELAFQAQRESLRAAG